MHEKTPVRKQFDPNCASAARCFCFPNGGPGGFQAGGGGGLDAERSTSNGLAATQPEPVVRGTILSYHFKLKKKRTNSIQGKSPSVHVRSVGLSLNHTSPQTYNPKTHVPMVLPDTPQTHVVPGTHALVGVVPCTTSTRSTNAQRAAQHMPSLTRFTAPYDGGVEVLVEPPWSKTTCSTW